MALATPRSATPRSATPRALRLAGLASIGTSTTPRRLGQDTAPGVRACGKEAPPAEGGVILPTPRTPELDDLRKRHRRRTEPGEITQHWGARQPGRPALPEAFGVRSAKGEHVKENFQAGQIFGVAEYLHGRGEAIYQSTTREPLGASYARGHALPAETAQPGFRFGRKPVPSSDAKESIFPRGLEGESREARERYRKTHGSFLPGEALERCYDWPAHVSEDPHFRFGAEGARQGAGVRSALNTDCEDDGTLPKTRIVKRTAEDCRKVVNDQLGTSRSLMQGAPPLPPDHAFGRSTAEDELKAGDLIRGFYTPREQQPDDDLGQCTLPGKRNFHGPRHFGVPSVRRDLPFRPQEKRSVAAVVDYGDGTDAYRLLNPQRFEALGVSDRDFRARLPKDQLQHLFGTAGLSLAPEDFEDVWRCAQQWFEDGRPEVSLEVFIAVYADWASQRGSSA